MQTDNILKRQYGFFTSMCIVIGFIVGTGIFWRPGRVLYESGGSVGLGVLAWIIGGLLISTCVYMFAVMATKYEKIHGMVDYAEALVGKKYGYSAGWFFCIMYQTAGFAIIAWISATFTATLAGHYNTTNSTFVFFIAAFYMVMTFVVNYLSPKLPIRLNNFTTVVRIIPIVAMGLVGTFMAIVASTNDTSSGLYNEIYYVEHIVATQSFLGAIFATVFAYNGWQAAAAFNSEINDSKRKFPLALIIGFFVVMIIYVLYFIGLTAAADNNQLMVYNALGTRAAFANVFGGAASNIIMIFVIISGLGILNMCCMGMSRGLYALARRNKGPMPSRMIQLDKETGIPTTSMVFCLGMSFLWFGVIYANHHNWFVLPNGTVFRVDLPDFYNLFFFVLLIPIFVGFIIKHYKDTSMHFVNRIIAPILATAASAFMIYALASSSFIHVVVYTAMFIGFLSIGFLFYRGGHVD